MINDQELLFVVDENNKPLKPETRSVVHKNRMWHRCTGIWVVNRLKQVLCQKRSLKKDIKPGMWEAFFGGHLAPDEAYFENALAELKEELGIYVNEASLIPYKILKSDKPTHKEFQHVFAVILEEKTVNFQFEKDEIDQLQWLDIDKVREILVDKNDSKWVYKPWDDEVFNWLNSKLAVL